MKPTREIDPFIYRQHTTAAAAERKAGNYIL
jgi:hypothetical protein